MAGHERIETVADILPFWAARTPRRTALMEMGADGRLTGISYAELNRQVDAFAAHLLTRGAERGRRVAIVMPNSARWFVAYYAVHRLGAVAVPLEYDMLRQRPDLLDFALEHCSAACVICEEADASALGSLAGGREIVTAREAEAPWDGPALPPPGTGPDDLAQILYTSGTTGPKKGVELTHGNVIFDTHRCRDRIRVLPNECVPALLPYHHGFPLTTTVVLPLLAGARAVAGDVKGRGMRDLLRLCRPTVLVGVPRVFESILQSIRSTAARAGKLSAFERACRAVRTVKGLTGVNVGKLIFRRLHLRLFGGLQLRFCVTGGARVPVGVLRDYFLLGIPLLQGWGMTELSPVAAVQGFSRVRFYVTRHYERKAGSIGAALPGTTVTLMPDPEEAAPPGAGERGEMVVSGPHVMRGYHREPELTARHMAAGGLRTGDIARRDADGDIYIIGRIKHVIVLASGKKVFPEDDLEEDLSRCPTIEEFIVRPIADEGGAEKIGIVVRPAIGELSARGVATLGGLYAAVKRDIDDALRDKPAYMRRYDFCLTQWADGEYAELVKTALGDPSPLKNAFEPARAHSTMKDSDRPVPFL